MALVVINHLLRITAPYLPAATCTEESTTQSWENQSSSFRPFTDHACMMHSVVQTAEIFE
jgi:hypothetical protein